MTRTDIPHPASFKTGVRVLLLMLRAKDGGSAKTDRKATKKVVTQSPAEFDEALIELRSLWRPDERIYSTINARNLDKAIRLFRYRQLDADYFAIPDKHSFYLDLENRWIGCLKSPQAAAGSLFLFDIDADVPPAIHQTMTAKVAEWDVVDDYKTRNGRHVITTPFNPNILLNFDHKHGETAVRQCLHKNALMLWSY
jgi:hypothetical protein